MSFRKKLTLLNVSGVMAILGLGSFFIPGPASAINCSEVRQLTGHYLRLHYSYHSFDDELSSRTLDNFIKAWDPGKVYFLKSDVTDIRNRYATKIDDMVNDGDCSAIDTIINVYSKRFAERQPIIAKLIEAKHNFSIDEYMNIDRKTLKWATTTEEVNERWRKRIKYQHLQLKSGSLTSEKIREKLHKRYKLAAKRHNEVTSDDLYSIFLNSFSSSLDPHSGYLSPEQLEDFRISTRLSLEGIGAVLRSEGGYTTIQSLVAGGAAATAGDVKVGDKIMAVAQGAEPPADVVDMDLRDVVKLIRGPRGTEVRLSLSRVEGDKTKKYIAVIIREKIQLEDKAARSFVYEIDALSKTPQNPSSAKRGERGKVTTKTYRIGVIDLPSFYIDFEGRVSRKSDFKSSSVDMKNEIEKLKMKNVDAIIVDLRSNGGGSLDEAIKISGLFFDRGPVVQIKGTDKSPYVSEDDDGKTYYAGPLVVMIDRQSASASEIFAGAIQDYGRGLIVGDSHTFGKGTVQNMNNLSPRLGAIKVTISKFYRPSGGSTQLKGVASDIVLPSLADHLEIGEKHYDFALPWDKIKASTHPLFNAVSMYRSQLNATSKIRLSKDSDFKKVLDGIDEYEGNKKDRNRVTLKEKEADESDDDNAGKASKKNSLASSKSSDPDQPNAGQSKSSLAKSKKSNDGKSEKIDEDVELAKDENGKVVPNLKYDIYLKEAIRIATDYTRLLHKQKTVELKVTNTLPLGAKIIVAKKSEKSHQ